jgi:hypothetical protein
MDTPHSMTAELQAWNDGQGIDLATWVGCEGRFALAVGYLAAFWPEFELKDHHIVPKGTTDEALRSFAKHPDSTRQSVEAMLNHLHLADIHYLGCPDISADKLIALGTTLKEMYEAKLHWQFPDRPCTVELFVPNNPDDLVAYQLTFWQS